MRSGERVDKVMIYRDINHAIDHAPDVAGPWALMVQYTQPFDPSTATAIWDEFTNRFLVRSQKGAHATVVPGSDTEDIRTTCLAVWLARELGDVETFEQTLSWADAHYQPRHEANEFAYWFGLDESHPRGQWNNAIMNAFVAPKGTWSSILE